MTAHDFHLFETGLYTIPEASRLTGIPSQSIRRWAHGYSYTRSGERHSLEPVVTTELAKKMLELNHPFSSRKFRTDGCHIFADIAREHGAEELLNLSNSQMAFKRVLAPLLREVEFEDDIATRWWALRKSVVIDPKRSFGQPVLNEAGIPTATLYQAYLAEEEIEPVASWYEVPIQAVLNAIEFETAMAASEQGGVMAKGFTGFEAEDAALTRFPEFGYTHTHGPDIVGDGHTPARVRQQGSHS